MSRVKLSEFKAKTLLYQAFGETYTGTSIDVRQNYSAKISKFFTNNNSTAVLKVDQAIKKRNKLGLIKLNVDSSNVTTYIDEFSKMGYTHLLLEPMIAHKDSDERFLSISLMEDGIRLLHSLSGGVDVESNKESINISEIKNNQELDAVMVAEFTKESLNIITNLFHTEHISNLEINPYIAIDNKIYFLDAAFEVDGSAEFFSSWSADDIRTAEKQTHPTEKMVEQLAATSPASLSLKVSNENGSIFMLLSGGGASVVLLDEIAASKRIQNVANYGEYSGNPSRQETYLYTKQVLELMDKSTSETKILVIAGGVANFTDIKKTFDGIIDAMKEFLPMLTQPRTHVIVRRGGPNERDGLVHMEQFLRKEHINGRVKGADTSLTQTVAESLQFLEKKS